MNRIVIQFDYDNKSVANKTVEWLAERVGYRINGVSSTDTTFELYRDFIVQTAQEYSCEYYFGRVIRGKGWKMASLYFVKRKNSNLPYAERGCLVVEIDNDLLAVEFKLLQ
jgi:hypothetical protein